MVMEDAKAVTETVRELYKRRFGYAPDNKDRKKAAEYVSWRYGGQGFLDAVKVIQGLRRAAEETRARTIIEGVK
jgi:hypothetical protein